MTTSIQSIRGMADVLPNEVPLWRYVEQVFGQLIHQYGYQEVRFPLVESTDLFKRAIGEATDVVEKEMYTFKDLNGDSLTLRPEGTASCVRLGIEHGLFYNQQQRLWYYGPMFRHEKPQKGRYRQFHQIGVEAFGMQGPDVDIEMILMTARLWKKLGFHEKEVVLHLNTLGTSAVRARYKEILVDYFTRHFNELDEDSQRRLKTNPLRILDSKNPAMQTINDQAPQLMDYLDEHSKNHFATIEAALKEAHINYQIDSRLVRGLDYYSLTVFEWVTDQLGSQGSICGGGRYDQLIEMMGGTPTPAIGFAIGVERLIELMKVKNLFPRTVNPGLDIIFILLGDDTLKRGLMIAEHLRDILPSQSLLVSSGPQDSLKNQLRKADRSGARLALILGEDELATHSVIVKFLREKREQEKVEWDRLNEFLIKIMKI